MQFNHQFAVLGCLAFAIVHALPSDKNKLDSAVYTAGNYDPGNLASDSLWEKYREKGSHYQCLFATDDEGAGLLIGDSRMPPSAQSLWKGSMYAERYLWNWHENYFDEDNCNFEGLHLKDAFDALKVDTSCEEDGGLNVGWSLGHYDEGRVDDSDSSPFPNMLPPIKQTYVVEGKTYKSTGGYYSFVVNQVDGAIVVLDITSPRNAIKTHWRSIGGVTSSEELPKLRYASDLIWGKWVENNANVKNLRYYAVHNVLNDETTAIVSRAMHNRLVSQLAVWPGTAFDKDKDRAEFQALIGSPIGGTIAIMLAQHKIELGNKEIYQINIISDNWSLKAHQVTEMHIFFHLRDAAVPNTEELHTPARTLAQ